MLEGISVVENYELLWKVAVSMSVSESQNATTIIHQIPQVPTFSPDISNCEDAVEEMYLRSFYNTKESKESYVSKGDWDLEACLFEDKGGNSDVDWFHQIKKEMSNIHQ